MNQKIESHTVVSYDGLWNLYNTSDVDANGKIWDMYSTKRWNTGSNHCGNYKLVGDCYNREHSFPKSWFNDAKPMYSDAYHLYPTDGKVNGQRSNYPYGECANGTTLPSNGSVRALGRLGSSTFSGYSGTVFEPDDQYKGDFARSYFYMAACYNDKIASWDSPMLAGNSYPAFSTWAVNLLLKWSRQDPVSQKELDRNEAVYAAQHNRNPFIDHPELAEYIWGDKKSQSWSATATAEPEFVLPAAGHAYEMGTVAVGVSRTVSIPVQGKNLESAVSASITGSGFAVSPSSISASAANASAGTTVGVSLTATTAGSHSATLRLTSGSATVSCTISATAVNGLPAGPATNVASNGFTATWTNIDATGATYTLDVKRQGQSIAGYPRSVSASAEHYDVGDLEPETAYTYTVSNGTLTSAEVAVTTAAPLPSVSFLYDGEWVIYTQEQTPSEALEVVVDIENLPSDVTVTVVSPFEVSLDKSSWGSSVVLVPGADRLYLRLGAAAAGDYTTSLVATATGFRNDDVDIAGHVLSATPTFIETFERQMADGVSATYGIVNPYQGMAATWRLCGVYLAWGGDMAYNHTTDGQQAGRTAKNGCRELTMLTDKTRGMGTLTLWAHLWRDDTAPATFDIYISESSDTLNLQKVGSITVNPSTVKDSKGYNDYQAYTLAINNPRAKRLKIAQTSGARTMLDDITLGDYAATSLETVLDYHTWDAYCRSGQLVIENSRADNRFSVYSLDGVERYAGAAPLGVTTLELPEGLYIVAVDGFARRVVVR